MSEEFDKDGLAYKRIGSSQKKKRKFGQKKWNLVYMNLIGGSLHYYKDEDDQDPKGTIELAKLKIYPDEKQGSTTKSFCLALKNDDLDFLFAWDEEAEYKAWLEAIQANMTKSPCAPLKKEKRKSRAQELAFKAKKNVVGKAASTSVGKKAIRGAAPDEVKELINSVKKIVERSTGSPKKAQEIEHNLFKIGIKAYFVVDEGKIKIDELLAADKPLRAGLELLAKCHDHAKFSRNPNPKLLREKFGEVQRLLGEAGQILSKLLEPHVKPKHVVLIKETLDFLGDPDRLLAIFTDDTLDDPLQELISAAEHYTQFHFYAEK
jgi:hypothetical protein